MAPSTRRLLFAIFVAAPLVSSNALSLRHTEDAAVAEEQEISLPAFESENLFEGDMVVSYGQISALYGKEVADRLVKEGKVTLEAENRDLGVMTRGIWTTRDSTGKVVIPYEIDQASGFTSSNLAEISKSIKTLEDGVMSIRFVARTSESSYIFIQGTNSGCWSYVGKVGGKQAVNLGNGCAYERVIVHELMHALSMYHEQSRPDRDSKVRINFENIVAGKESNFYIQSDINSLGSEYDTQSVMHYTSTSFGKYEPQCTMKGNLCYGIEIMFIGSGSDATSPTCISDTGTLATCTGQPIWNVEADGNRVTLKLRSDPAKCFDAETLSTKECTSSSTQSLQIHGSSFSSVRLRWEGDNANYIFPKSSRELGFLRSASNSNDDFRIVATPYFAPHCASVSLCSFQTTFLKTIEALDGKSVGGDKVSQSDFLQLQLMYQCPGGARTMSNLCTEDCPCFEDQKSCKTDADCRGDLRCNSTAYCVPASSIPCVYVPVTGKQYGTKQFGKLFEANVNIKLHSINPNSWTNIFHVGEHAKDRVVSVFVAPNTSFLSIRVASIRSWNNNCDGQTALQLGRSYNVKIVVADGLIRTFLDGSLYCSAQLNGEEAIGAPVAKPLFVSVPGYVSADACLSPITFTTLTPSSCHTAAKGKVLRQITFGNTFVAKAVFTLYTINPTSWTNIFHVGSENYPRFASAYILPNTSTLSFRVASTTSNNVACTARSSLNLNQLYRVSLVVSGEMARVFVNDIEECSVSLPGNSPGVTNEPLFTSSPYFEPANACIESVTFT